MFFLCFLEIFLKGRMSDNLHRICCSKSVFLYLTPSFLHYENRVKINLLIANIKMELIRGVYKKGGAPPFINTPKCDILPPCRPLV